jgi:1-deoxy-D-xylulose-5-phosphate reductoisomerase
VAVAAFLAGGIGFIEIPRIIEDTLAATGSGKMGSITQVLEVDAEARRYAKQRIADSSGKLNRPPTPSFV